MTGAQWDRSLVHVFAPRAFVAEGRTGAGSRVNPKKKTGCDTVQTDLTLCLAIAMGKITIENSCRIGAKIDFLGYF
jgi:hypothetical protein